MLNGAMLLRANGKLGSSTAEKAGAVHRRGGRGQHVDLGERAVHVFTQTRAQPLGLDVLVAGDEGAGHQLLAEHLAVEVRPLAQVTRVVRERLGEHDRP